jgi:hypothetical protein
MILVISSLAITPQSWAWIAGPAFHGSEVTTWTSGWIPHYINNVKGVAYYTRTGGYASVNGEPFSLDADKSTLARIFKGANPSLTVISVELVIQFKSARTDVPQISIDNAYVDGGEQVYRPNPDGCVVDLQIVTLGAQTNLFQLEKHGNATLNAWHWQARLANQTKEQAYGKSH